MNSNDFNDLKEEVSCAYLNFIASCAGYSFQRADRRSDNDGIDGTIKAPRRLFSSRPQLEVQVKGTSRSVLEGDRLRYPLKVKNYQELISDAPLVPQVLVVVLFPEDVDQWFRQSEAELTIRLSAYWLSLRGYPPTNNQYAETVYLSRTQLLTVDELKRIMQRIARGEAL